MTATAALAAGRRAAEGLMVDSCTITRPGAGDPVFNPATGGYTDPAPVEVYSGRCRVQVTASLDVRATGHGGQAVNLTRVTVTIPIDATDVLPEDVVAIDTAAHDTVLASRTMTVKGAEAKTHATARRLECELTS